MKNNEIIIIAGLPRSGTSLVCQMLSAAGIRVAGDYPMFEPDEILESPDAAFISTCEGGAVKLIDPHHHIIPKDYAYRIVFLSRSKRQQALSTAKFMIAMDMVTNGRCFTDAGLGKMRESLIRDEKLALAELWTHGCPIHRIKFEDLIGQAAVAVSSLADFLGIDQNLVGSMVAAIRPRPHGALNYPGLLEVELMQEQEARDGKSPAYDPLRCECKFPGVVAPCGYCKDGDYCLEDEQSKP
jgi:hypothetical protein